MIDGSSYIFCAACIATAMVSASRVLAFEITHSQRLTNGVALAGVSLSVPGDNTITASEVSADRHQYNWSDRDGDGASNAVATAGLDLQTYRLWNEDNQSFDLYLNGGSIFGELHEVAFDTHRTGGPWDARSAGSVRIFDVGAVAIGKMLSYSTAGGGSSAVLGHGGHIEIGTALVRSGTLRIAGLESYATGRGNGGKISLFASGHVHVVDGNGVPAAIDSRGNSTSAGAGDIMIDHLGSFLAGNINAYSSGDNYATGGNVTLTGSGTGSCVASNILTHSSFTHTGWVGQAGTVLIRGYTDVNIAGVNAENRGNNHGTKTAGNLVITNISNSIILSGTLDLHSVAGGDNMGYALLEAGKSISVADVNLNRVRYIAFNSQGKKNYFAGTLTNFTGTAESADDNRLRAPSGHRIYYKPELNPHLNGAAYPLKGLDGIGNGGTLMTEPARGTVIFFR
jgi:hypothetical protein